jgi:hypothetical protein
LADKLAAVEQIDSDLFVSFARRRSDQISVLDLRSPARKGEMPRPVVAGTLGAFDDQRLRRALRFAQDQRDRGLWDAVSLNRHAARGHKSLIELSTDHLEIAHL